MENIEKYNSFRLSLTAGFEGIELMEWGACSGYSVSASRKYRMSTLPETNIALENQWLEDEISFWDSLF